MSNLLSLMLRVEYSALRIRLLFTFLADTNGLARSEPPAYNPVRYVLPPARPLVRLPVCLTVSLPTYPSVRPSVL